jgi:hypothetical protein
MTEPEPVVTVFLTNAVRTSAGPGPGVKHLPPAEAAVLVTGRDSRGQPVPRVAVYGDQPPRGFDGTTDDGLRH